MGCLNTLLLILIIILLLGGGSYLFNFLFGLTMIGFIVIIIVSILVTIWVYKFFKELL